MDPLNQKTKAAFAVTGAGAVSWLGWHVSTSLIPLTVAFPALAITRPRRAGAGAVAFVYYALASTPILEISSGYFRTRHIWTGVLVWVAASALLATPWLILWSRDSGEVWWRLATALLVATVPPAGIVGWASPITAAGLLFPGMGWLGVLLTLAPIVGIGLSEWSAVFTLALSSVAANVSYEPPLPKSEWIAMNTEFGSIHASGDPIVALSIADQIQRAALDGPGRVIVFPEMVVRSWSEATDLFWQPTVNRLRERNRTILIGAGFASSASPEEYRNGVVIRGADRAIELTQRIPVPLAMWKPWGGKDRVPLNLFGPSVVQLAGERTAMLICYEELLPWSYLSAAVHHPTIFVGLSNAYWTKSTVIPKYQDAALRCWGRLFGIPVISATNY
jgi:hypothetical protein